MMSDDFINQPHITDENYDLLIQSAILFLDIQALSDAADKCSAAIRIDQDRCEAYLVLSVAAYLMDDLGRAMELALIAHEASPDCLEASEALAHYYAHAGSMNDSVYYAKLGTIGVSNPLLAKINVDGLNNLPKAINEARETSYRVEAMRAYYEERYGDAVVSFEKELRLNKGNAELFRLFGHSLCEIGNISRGLAAVLGAVHLDHDNAENYISLASVYASLGDHVLAKSCYGRAMYLAKDDLKILIASSCYQEKTQLPWSELEHASKAWVEGAASENKFVQGEQDAPNETLSIGFLIDRSCVSDISRIIEPMLWHHDREKIDYYVYSRDIPNDLASLKLRNIVRYWLDTYEVRDNTLAATINSHNLDLLIDLTVTEEGCRPAVIARHPAKTILRWLGPSQGVFSYGYDGALNSLKKKKSDPDSILPIILNPDIMPEINGDSPCQSQEYVTFGASCDLSKLTPDTVMLWGEILRAVPGAKLLLGNSTVISDEIQNRCHEMFTAAGVHDHIEFEVMQPGTNGNQIVPRLQYMVGIDVYLDTFPSNGFVELADALWAGVPVVTLAGTKKQSMAEAILIAGEHGEYIARGAHQYVDYAVLAANAVLEDVNWRKNMHNKVRESGLYNPEQWGELFADVLQAIARPKPPVRKKSVPKPSAGTKASKKAKDK